MIAKLVKLVLPFTEACIAQTAKKVNLIRRRYYRFIDNIFFSTPTASRQISWSISKMNIFSTDKLMDDGRMIVGWDQSPGCCC